MVYFSHFPVQGKVDRRSKVGILATQAQNQKAAECLPGIASSGNDPFSNTSCQTPLQQGSETTQRPPSTSQRLSSGPQFTPGSEQLEHRFGVFPVLGVAGRASPCVVTVASAPGGTWRMKPAKGPGPFSLLHIGAPFLLPALTHPNSPTFLPLVLLVILLTCCLLR